MPCLCPACPVDEPYAGEPQSSRASDKRQAKNLLGARGFVLYSALMEDVQPHTPILIGAGQCVHRAGAGFSPSPIEMMAAAAKRALADLGADAGATLSGNLIGEIDCIAAIRFILDSPESRRFPFGHYHNVPKSLAQALGAQPPALVYSPTGGNAPQMMVNLMAERIARGQHRLIVLAGAECMHTLVRALKEGEDLGWLDAHDPSEMEDLGAGEISGSSESEIAHGLHYPINVYPLFENALRQHYGRSIPAHQQALGELMSPFTKIAAAHQQAWFPRARAADEIAQESAANRYVGFPYTKYMNAIMRVDQSAALVLSDVETAERLGVPREKWVFLHGCGDAHDVWCVSERVNYHSSPAIRHIAQSAFDMAGWQAGDVDFIDLYSCFPCAVQIARDAIGIAADDPRALTVTGGLPYFGGAGNNYTMHSIATMMEKLRAAPGSKGLCTANGYYLTKHSIGLYSTAAKGGRWTRTPPDQLQAEVDAMPHPLAEAKPEGKSTIETYTVLHGREGVEHGLMIGRLENDRRFCAHITDPDLRDRLMTEDCFGMAGSVKAGDKGINYWTAA